MKGLVRTVIIFFTISFLMTGCGGGGGDGGDNSIGLEVTSFELVDPTPGANDNFGEIVVILGNGNIVVTDPNDRSVMVGKSNGAVHLYNPVTQTRIASFYGDNSNDKLGSTGIVALGNSNFVILSENDSVGGMTAAGSVILVNGSTGAQIGTTIAGDVAGDNLGFSGVTALGNNNFVIASRLDDEGGIVDAGSVRLVDGSTGAQIGTTLVGDIAGDQLGRGDVVALGNNNFVVPSKTDDEGGVVDAGSVLLVDGSTGAQIGTTIAGDNTSDSLSDSGIIALGNNNFVINSSIDDEGGIVDAGSVRLVNGSTGAQIGSPLIGDNASDFLGFSNGTEATALATNNFVIVSEIDNEGGITNAGSVRLVDGSTGLQIGDSIIGSVSLDFDTAIITPSETGLYYILRAPSADNGGLVDSGLVRVIAP